MMVSTFLQGKKNGLNELTGSLPVCETWPSQGTELERGMLGKQR